MMAWVHRLLDNGQRKTGRGTVVGEAVLSKRYTHSIRWSLPLGTKPAQHENGNAWRAQNDAVSRVFPPLCGNPTVSLGNPSPACGAWLREKREVHYRKTSANQIGSHHRASGNAPKLRSWDKEQWNCVVFRGNWKLSTLRFSCLFSCKQPSRWRAWKRRKPILLSRVLSEFLATSKGYFGFNLILWALPGSVLNSRAGSKIVGVWGPDKSSFMELGSGKRLKRWSSQHL